MPQNCGPKSKRTVSKPNDLCYLSDSEDEDQDVVAEGSQRKDRAKLSTAQDTEFSAYSKVADTSYSCNEVANLMDTGGPAKTSRDNSNHAAGLGKPLPREHRSEDLSVKNHGKRDAEVLKDNITGTGTHKPKKAKANKKNQNIRVSQESEDSPTALYRSSLNSKDIYQASVPLPSKASKIPSKEHEPVLPKRGDNAAALPRSKIKSTKLTASSKSTSRPQISGRSTGSGLQASQTHSSNSATHASEESVRITKPSYKHVCHTLGYNPGNLAKSLHDDGYIVVKVPWLTTKRLHDLREELLREVRSFPEFKPGAESFVMGGFSALGNPSSFHNKPVRQLRQFAMAEMIPMFSAYINRYLKEVEHGWALEQIIDRLMIRPKGIAPSAEAWHRDEAPNANSEDCIFGGWWNLNDEDQYFSCLPGSHTSEKKRQGFATVKSKEEKDHLSSLKRKVIVPRGHILIFQEDIMHEIVAHKAKFLTIRLFIGWRLSCEEGNEDRPLVSDLKSLLREQAVVTLKSKQIPPMYAKLHWTNWRSRIVEFTQKNISDACTEERIVGSGKDKGTKVKVVAQHMKSLVAYNLPLYPDYEQEESEILFPRAEWNLKCGCGEYSTQFLEDP